MRDLDRDVDDKQMTHSDEDTAYDHTTEKEWAEWLEEAPAAASVYRLIKDVKRLETERDKFRGLTKRAAVGGLPLAGVDVAELIDKLETEVKRLREFADELAAHPGSLSDSWRVNDICIHCWALRLLGQDYVGLHD